MPTSLRHHLGRLALFALLGLSSLHADVSINFFAGEFYNADGSSPLPDGSLVLLISDTSHNGFGSLRPGALDVGAFLDGLDDLILARAAVFTGLGSSSTIGALSNVSLSEQWNAGDPLALVWFSGLDENSTFLSAGTAYGYYSATIPLDLSDSWVTPVDGSDPITIKFLSSAVEGSYDDALFRTNLTVSAVPEPATYAALAGLAALGLALWRRRKTC